MVMNHLPRPDKALIRSTVEYVTGERARELKGVRPFWMDVNNCKADPIYNIPGIGTRAARKAGPNPTHKRFRDFPEFAAAFACAEGSPMVRPAAERCEVW